jgi:threonine synthase
VGLCPIYFKYYITPTKFLQLPPSSYQYIPLTRSFSAPMAPYTPSQRYSSTRGGSPGVNSVPSACHAIFTYGLQVSFEEAVFKGLAPDNGLFVPETIPSLPSNWKKDWVNLPFQFLAFEILSLFISPAEIPHDSLRAIIRQSYSSFRVPSITPTITLDNERKIHLLELFHGPTFAFKDVALQFLGNLLEFFLKRRNQARAKARQGREHLTVIGATSGDTGSAGIYGLRGMKDISVFIMFPTGKISPVQEAQMTTVTDANGRFLLSSRQCISAKRANAGLVHCLSVDGTFDDCQVHVPRPLIVCMIADDIIQELLKDLFADPSLNAAYNITSVNSINVSRILAQISYYFASYFSLIRSGTFDPSTDQLSVAVPTGNFGSILAGFFAKRMGLPILRLIISTNENDIIHRFLQTGAYEKPILLNTSAKEKMDHAGGVKETLSPAMDILISSNFERLLWFIAYDVYSSRMDHTGNRRDIASLKVKEWQTALKSKGGFSVEQEVLDAVRAEFSSERVSDVETLATIRDVYQWPYADNSGSNHYVLDPHSAVGVAAALRSAEAAPGIHYVALSTAHPAKFSRAVEMALAEEKAFQFNDILPPQLSRLDRLPRRAIRVHRSEGLDRIRKIIMDEVEKEMKETPSS